MNMNNEAEIIISNFEMTIFTIHLDYVMDKNTGFYGKCVNC